jgi:hypothetical protein
LRSYVPDHVRGFAAKVGDTRVAVGWLTENKQLSITAFGSSSCPDIPTGLDVIAPTEVHVRFQGTATSDCTADLAPRTHILALSDDVITDGSSGPLVVEMELPTAEKISGVEDPVSLKINVLIPE